MSHMPIYQSRHGPQDDALRVESFERLSSDLNDRAADAVATASVLVADSRALLAAAALFRDPYGMADQCAWCGRLSLTGDVWWSRDELPLHLLPMLRAHSTHGICPDCMTDVVATGTTHD